MKFEQKVAILGVEEKAGEKNGKMWRFAIVKLLSNDFKVFDAMVSREISESPRLQELLKIHNEEYTVTLKIVPKGKYDISLELVDF